MALRPSLAPQPVAPRDHLMAQACVACGAVQVVDLVLGELVGEGRVDRVHGSVPFE